MRTLRKTGGMRRTSPAILMAVGLVATTGACGERVAEEERPPTEEVELALEQEAEPELADRGVETEEPAPASVETTPVRPNPAPAPAPAPPPEPVEEQSPVRGVPPAAQAPEIPEEPPVPPTVTLTAQAGAEFEAVLLEELSTRTNQPGDRFRLRVKTPLIDGNRVVVQQNSYIEGEVTALQRSGGQGEEAVIKVDFHEVVMLGGSWPISATVVEAEPTTRGSYNTGDKAARIGAGAVAGAILGRVIGGDTKGTVIGAAVGAAAGTAITLVTEDVDAVLPEGSVLRLRLDRPLTVQVPGD
ncbi:MAG: hypothetical protein R3195_06890 [Gemmatimonadota bacterium]|nr:hypothetical protein [Gemmatimonadota bacterium]